MPPRNPELPEGTDHIVSGAGQTGGGTRPPTGGTRLPATAPTTTPATTGGTQGGFVASGAGNDTGGNAANRAPGGGSSGVRDKLKDQAAGIKDKAADKLRDVADDGKSRATGVLAELCGVMEDAAKSIDDRLGPEYGEYAHKAADYVSGWNQSFRDKSVDDLLDDTRSVVRKSPAVAIAAAAVAGFALMRVLKTGLEDMGATSNSDGGALGSGGGRTGQAGGGGTLGSGT